MGLGLRGIVEAGAGGLEDAGSEKALENENGGDLIDDGTMLLAGFAHGVEVTMGFAGAQTFVREVDGKVEGGADLFGESLGFEGLGADLAGHMEGIADDDLGDGVFAEDTADGFEVGARSGAIEGEERLDGEAEGIRDGEADAFAADIKGEEAGRQGYRLNLGLEELVHACSVAVRVRRRSL